MFKLLNNKPINNSKGCGGVMRAAPVGLFHPREQAFQIAAECAALTHGHPSGYLSAGVLAYIIVSVIEGSELAVSVEGALGELKNYRGHEGCTRIIKRAVGLYNSGAGPAEAVPELGEGWIGEEAIAISIYCALRYKESFSKALIASVNHNGDSDSTGAITGNIIGAYLGLKGIPDGWAAKVELSDIIMQIADDLLAGYKEGREWWDKYPGY